MGNIRGIELMQQTGGGVIQQGVLDEYPAPPEPVEVELPVADLQRLLGMDVSMQQAADVLSRLGFDVTLDGETIQAVTPDYRTDISGGLVGRADLVEEIVRIIGYDRIPLTVMDDVLPEQRSNRQLELEEETRDMLVGLGLTENISYRFTTPEAEAMLTPPGSVPSFPEVGYVELANPIASDKKVMRHTLLRNLLENAARNARFNARQQVFEIGSVYYRHEAGELPEEPTRLAVLMTGPRHVADWTGDDDGQAVDFFDLKGVIEELLTGLHITGWTVSRSEHSSLHPGRSAALSIGETHIGDFGELHPKVAQAVRLDEFPVLVAELDLDTLLQHAPDFFRLNTIPTTPPVLEDIALVVPESVTAAELEAVIRKAGGELLRDVRLFDVYRGESIESGKKSLTYSLTYQAEGETLTDKDVKSARKSIIYLTGEELGAELRS
jgi:phenylalanyl-tRNA synthetase beta chain